MNKTNVKIAQQLFKNAVQLIKQECYTNPENIKKAIEAKRKKLGRKPRTAKEHEEWRKNQRKKFKLW